MTVDEFDSAVYDVIDDIEFAKNNLTKLKFNDVNLNDRMSPDELKSIIFETKMKLNQALEELRKSLY